MPYALFENDDRLTRPFRTEREVWEAAARADLTTTDSQGGKVLDNNFEIKPCEASPDELFATNGQEINGQDIVFPDRSMDNSGQGRAVPDAARSVGGENTPAKRGKSAS